MDTQKKYTTKNFKATQSLGQRLASDTLAKKPAISAVVLALKGDLGSGKTTFLQGFAKGLGIKEKILSPTFIVMKRFMIYDLRFKNFYHIDCYRLKDEKDLEALGIKEIISNPENIIAIEWPEKLEDILPKNKNSIQFNYIDETTREITFKG